MYQKKTSKQECLVPVVVQQDNERKLLPPEETCVKEKDNEEPMIIDEPLLVCAHINMSHTKITFISNF